MVIDISILNNYEGKIKTDNGYIDFENIPTKFENCYELAFSNNTILKVSYNHLFEDINGNWILAEQLDENTPILADGGIVYLINKKYIGKYEVYDVCVDSDKHQYYLDGISSHNSGKTLLAISAAMELIKRKDFQRIVYIRNSIESLAKGEDVGYLSGNDEKFEIYNFPLFDTLAYIASKMISKSNQNKQGKGKTDNIPTEELISEKVEQLVERFQVETMWVGSLRGRTISNAVVIIDECLHKNQKIQTDKGIFSIEDITNRIANNEVVNVVSINLKTKKKEIKPIISIKKELIKDKMFEIEMEDGTLLKLTSNHKVRVNDKWETIEDIIIRIKNGEEVEIEKY